MKFGVWRKRMMWWPNMIDISGSSEALLQKMNLIVNLWWRTDSKLIAGNSTFFLHISTRSISLVLPVAQEVRLSWNSDRFQDKWSKVSIKRHPLPSLLQLKSKQEIHIWSYSTPTTLLHMIIHKTCDIQVIYNNTNYYLEVFPNISVWQQFRFTVPIDTF